MNGFLYKYRGVSDKDTLDKVIQNIINNEFYAANKNQLNDPNEFYIDDSEVYSFINNLPLILSDAVILGEYKRGISKENLETLLDTKLKKIKISKASRKEYRSNRYFDSACYPHVQSLRDLQEKLAYQKDNAGVFSLTNNYSNELMWAHYGDSHKGFLIQYSYDAVASEIDFIKVEYVKSPPKFNIMDLDPSLNKAIVVQMLGAKSESWSYEEEYRILTKKSGTKKFKKPAITGIYFGANITEKNEHYIFEHLKDLELNFFKMKKVQKTYGLKAIPYNKWFKS